MNQFIFLVNNKDMEIKSDKRNRKNRVRRKTRNKLRNINYIKKLEEQKYILPFTVDGFMHLPIETLEKQEILNTWENISDKCIINNDKNVSIFYSYIGRYFY